MSLKLQPGVPQDWENYKRWNHEEELSPIDKKVHAIVDSTLNEVLTDLRRVTVAKTPSLYKNIKNTVFTGFSKFKKLIGLREEKLLPDKSKQKLVSLVTAKGNLDAAFNNLTEFSETRFQTTVHQLRKELDAANAALSQAAVPLIKQLNQEPVQARLTLSSYQNEYVAKAVKCKTEEDIANLQADYVEQNKSKDPLVRAKAKYILAFKNAYEIQQKFDRENDLYQNAPLIKQKAKEEFIKAQENLQEARDAVLKDSAIKRVCRDPESFFKLLNDSDLAENSFKQLKPIFEKLPTFKAELEKEQVQIGAGKELMEKLKRPTITHVDETEIPLINLSSANLSMKLQDLEFQLCACNLNETKMLMSLGKQIADVKLAMLDKLKEFAMQKSEQTLGESSPGLGIVHHYFVQANAIEDMRNAFEQGNMQEIIKYRAEIMEGLKGEKKGLTPQEFYADLFHITLTVEPIVAIVEPVTPVSETTDENILAELDALVASSKRKTDSPAVSAPVAPNEDDNLALIHEAAEKNRKLEELKQKQKQEKENMDKLQALNAFIELPNSRELISNFQDACKKFGESTDIESMKKLMPVVYSSGKKLLDAEKKSGWIDAAKYSAFLQAVMTNINVKGIDANSPIIAMLKQTLSLIAGESALLLQIINTVDNTEKPEPSASNQLLEKMGKGKTPKQETEDKSPSTSAKLMDLTSKTPDELMKKNKNKKKVEGP